MHLVDQQSSSFALSDAYDQATFIDYNTIGRLLFTINSVCCQIRTAAGRATRWYNAVIIDRALLFAGTFEDIDPVSRSHGFARRNFRVLRSSHVCMSRIITVPYDRNANG
jgi:hypothetical protein